MSSSALGTSQLAPTASPMPFYAVGSGVGDNSSNLYTFSYWNGFSSFTNIGETGLILWDIAISPSSPSIIYAIGQSGHLYSLDASTGAARYLGNTGHSGLSSLEFCGDTLYGWSDRALVTIQPSTGQLLSSMSVTAISSGDLMCSSTGGLYGISRGSTRDRLVVFNPLLGLVSWTGISLPGTGFFGGEFDGQDQLFVSRHHLGELHLYHVDLATNQISLVASRTTPLGMNGLAVLPVAW